jgi:capsular polysaccharide transport system permease protein
VFAGSSSFIGKSSESMRAPPNSPQIPPLRRHFAALEKQIAAERMKVVGGNDSVVLTISEYERPLLKHEVADKGLLSAITSLEAARLEAQRKQLYLDRVVEPNLPNYPIYPRRLVSILEVIFSALLIHSIAWLMRASVREHVGR